MMKIEKQREIYQTFSVWENPGLILTSKEVNKDE